MPRSQYEMYNRVTMTDNNNMGAQQCIHAYPKTEPESA
jgi:hypothetical protein